MKEMKITINHDNILSIVFIIVSLGTHTAQYIKETTLQNKNFS